MHSIIQDTHFHDVHVARMGHSCGPALNLRQGVEEKYSPETVAYIRK